MEKASPPGEVRSSEGLGGSREQRAKPLSYRQREMLRQAKDDWARLPIGAGCTNSTLNALEKRGLVETRVRYEASRHVPGARVTLWEWRKTPNAEVRR